MNLYGLNKDSKETTQRKQGAYMQKESKENKRHDAFQFGSNPMRMSPFERMMAEKEKGERFQAKRKYVQGIQGVDGGCSCN